VFAHDVHIGLAVLSIAAVALAVIEAAVRALRATPPGRLAEATSSIVVVVLGMTAAAGLAMLVRGERPSESLHLVYALLAFALIPVGDSLMASGQSRRRGLARLLAAVVTLGVVARLFATG
jgi:hypothetical protein